MLNRLLRRQMQKQDSGVGSVAAVPQKITRSGSLTVPPFGTCFFVHGQWMEQGAAYRRRVLEFLMRKNGIKLNSVKNA